MTQKNEMEKFDKDAKRKKNRTFKRNLVAEMCISLYQLTCYTPAIQLLGLSPDSGC